MNGTMPVVFGVEANTWPVCTSRPGEQRERAVADVLVLYADRFPGRGGQRGVDAAAGLDGRLGVEGQDPVTGAERLPAVKPLVQAQDHIRFRREVRVAGEDPGLVLPRLDRVPRQDPQQRRHRHRLADQGLRLQFAFQLRATPPGQRHARSSRQLAGQRDHRRPGLLADLPRAGRTWEGPSALPARAGRTGPAICAPWRQPRAGQRRSAR